MSCDLTPCRPAVVRVSVVCRAIDRVRQSIEVGVDVRKNATDLPPGRLLGASRARSNALKPLGKQRLVMVGVTGFEPATPTSRT